MLAIIQQTPIIRDAIATFWLVVDISLVGIFGVYLYGKYTHAISWTYWRKQAEVKAAIGIFMYFAGVMITRTSNWFVIVLAMYDDPRMYALAVLGNLIAMWGVTCIVRVFAQNRHLWIVVALLAFVTAMAIQIRPS